MTQPHDANATAHVRDFYERYAPRYDHETSYYDRFLLGDRRPRLCRRARGSVLEVAIGTGRNLPHYPPGIRLTGIDLTPAMLSVARHRAREIGMPVHLIRGDAQALPIADATFDTVVAAVVSVILLPARDSPSTDSCAGSSPKPTQVWRTSRSR